LYNRSPKKDSTGQESPDDMAAFKTFKKDTAKEQKRARSKYVNKFVTQAFEGNNKAILEICEIPKAR